MIVLRIAAICFIAFLHKQQLSSDSTVEFSKRNAKQDSLRVIDTLQLGLSYQLLASVSLQPIEASIAKFHKVRTIE